MDNPDDIASTTREIYEAFGDAGPDRVLTYFADDATYEDPTGGVHVGKAAVGAALAPGMSGRQTYVVDQLLVSGDASTITWTLEIGEGAGKISLFGVDVLRFASGQVVLKQCFMKATDLLIRTSEA